MTDDWDSGLLRSPLLLRVFKHIFTSPSSATRDEPGRMKTKGSQAKLNGMDSVSATSIAYAALQPGIEATLLLMRVYDEYGGRSLHAVKSRLP